MKIGLIGVGAIGAPLAKKFHDFDKNNFYVIAGGKRKQRLKTSGVIINGEKYLFNIMEPEDNTILDLILICTKFTHLDSVILDIKNHVNKKTKIISFLNGVSSEDILIKAFSKENIIYGFTRISSVNDNNNITFSNYGTYYFGDPKNDPVREEVQAISDVFTAAGINHEVPDDMLAHQWFKFMNNVGENQVSAVLDLPFGAWKVSDEANILREKALYEVNAIAKAKGINIKQEWIDNQRELLKNVPYHNVCSMVQDLRHKRTTEVDMFSKVVIEMGKEYHIATPINEMLYYMIKILEAKNAGEI